jgi:hypothetical protein
LFICHVVPLIGVTIWNKIWIGSGLK